MPSMPGQRLRSTHRHAIPRRRRIKSHHPSSLTRQQSVCFIIKANGISMIFKSQFSHLFFIDSSNTKAPQGAPRDPQGARKRPLGGSKKRLPGGPLTKRLLRGLKTASNMPREASHDIPRNIREAYMAHNPGTVAGGAEGHWIYISATVPCAQCGVS